MIKNLRVGVDLCGPTVGAKIFETLSLMTSEKVSKIMAPTVGPQRSTPTQRFVIMEKAPTRAFSWFKAAAMAFTFKNILNEDTMLNGR